MDANRKPIPCRGQLRTSPVSLSACASPGGCRRGLAGSLGLPCLIECGTKSADRQNKEAPRKIGTPGSTQNLYEPSYFPFLGAFFSSFLAFFFIRISSSVSADDGRHRPAFILDSIYGRSP